MSLYMKPLDVSEPLEKFNSVLIVSCPICPAISVAMDEKKPFIELFKHGLKTKVFEDYVKSIREPLEQRGIRTEVITMRVPNPLMCLWTEGQRNRLRARAKDYEAVLVLGCSSATATAQDALKGLECNIIQGMRKTGVVSATTKFRFPGTVEFDMKPMPKKLNIVGQKKPIEALRKAQETGS
jgi:hypothetical protein